MRGLLPALLLLSAFPSQGGALADVARQVHEAGLDPDACYRVRDLDIIKEDLHVYLTDGHLIFGKPVNGVRLTALFQADTDAGDAELLLFPPRRSERMSLASFTGSPNLSEHFVDAALVFSDDTAAQLLRAIKEAPTIKRVPEVGTSMAQNFSSLVNNLAGSFEIRLVNDLLSAKRGSRGFFYTTVNGKRLGNFDLSYDPVSTDQIMVGHISFRESQPYFDTWTNFQSRSLRTGASKGKFEGPVLQDFHIEARLQQDLSLQGVTRFEVRRHTQGEQALALEISPHMRVTGARVNGQPAEVYQHESMRETLLRGGANQSFLVALPADLGEGAPFEVEVTHEGSVISNAGNRVYFVGARGNWYPNWGMEFSNYDVTFRYPKNLDLVAAGLVVDDRREGEEKVTRRQTTAPMRAFGFNLGYFARTKLVRSGCTVEVCATREVEIPIPPRGAGFAVVPTVPWRRDEMGKATEPPDIPDVTTRLHTLAVKVAETFEFMSDRFGPPPWQNLTVSPIPGRFGQGFAGLVYVSTLAYFDRTDLPLAKLPEDEQIFFTDILHAHETAHQWWGNTVVPRGYQDEWLMEALADYSALLFLEKRKGRGAMESTLASYRSHLLERDEKGNTFESYGPIIWGNRLRNSQQPRAWRFITYEKGAWIIHMLRRMMGDEQFLVMLAELRKRYEFKPLDTEEFREFARSYLPANHPDPKLEVFFQEYVYDVGIPELKLSYTVTGTAPKLKVAGRLMQSGVNDEFSIFVPIEIRFGKGKSIIHWLRTDNDPVSFEVPVTQAPTKVVLDPGGAALAIHN